MQTLFNTITETNLHQYFSFSFYLCEKDVTIIRKEKLFHILSFCCQYYGLRREIILLNDAYSRKIYCCRDLHVNSK